MKELTLTDLQERRVQPMAKEAAARASIERRRGRAYTDDEWAEAKRNLLAFFSILAEADLKRVDR